MRNRHPDDSQLIALRRRTEVLSTVLDSAIAIPGTRIRVGIDALIGLIPIAGDLAGLLLGSWFVVEGWRIGAPGRLLLRMGGNLLIDATAGSLPLVGDVFDIAFRANLRNAQLLTDHIDGRLSGGAAARRSWLPLALLAAGVVAATTLAIVAAYRLLS